MLVEFKCRNCGVTLEGDSDMSGGQMDCPNCSASLLVPHPGISIGAMISGFKIERKIGEGGMGDVYLATQVSMDRKVAIKVLPPAMVANPSYLQRFLYEIRMTGQLEHPNIVAVYDAGDFEGVYYLAMSFIDGSSIEERLSQGRAIPEWETLQILRAIASALSFAWDKLRVLHRDIKPANIMLDRKGEVKLLDLGLAKSLDSDMGLTQANLVVGTPYYMSPEQANPTVDADFRADMYSLGATAFHMITGKRPYEGKTPRAILTQSANGPVPSLRDINPEISKETEKLIRRMMAPRREDRFASWQEVIAVANQLIGQMQIKRGGSDPGLIGLSNPVTPAPFVNSGLLPAAVQSYWQQGKKSVVFGFAAAVLLAAFFFVVGGIAVFNWARHAFKAKPEEPPPAPVAAVTPPVQAPAQPPLAPPEPAPPQPTPAPAADPAEAARLQLEKTARDSLAAQLGQERVQKHLARILNSSAAVTAADIGKLDISVVLETLLLAQKPETPAETPPAETGIPEPPAPPPVETPTTTQPQPEPAKPQPPLPAVPKTPAPEIVAAKRAKAETVIDLEVKKFSQDPKFQAALARQIGLSWPIRDAVLSPDNVGLLIQKRLAQAVEEKFPASKRDELKAEAAKLFSVIKPGDPVSLMLRGGVGHNPMVTGRFIGTEGGVAVIGSRRVRMNDLHRDDRVRFDPQEAAKRQEEYVELKMRHVEIAKSEFIAEHTPAITEAVYKEAHYAKIGDKWRPQKELFNERLEREIARRRPPIERKAYRDHGFVFEGGKWIYASEAGQAAE